MKQRIIAFANQKGGVGKTTTAVNIAAALALTGRKVLLIDTDPQANSSSHLGVKPTEDKQLTSYEFILREAPLSNVIVKAKENLDVIPTDTRLAAAEIELPMLQGKDIRLKLALQQASDYHYILIDSPPSLGQLTINALNAANELMIVMEAGVFAYDGVANLMKTLDQTKKFCNATVELTGLLLTKYEGATNLNKDIYEKISENFGDIVFKTLIRKNVRLGEAPAYKQDIFEYDSACAGAQDYADLCKEIIKMEGGVQ